jgi:hypothetical protein
MSGCHSGLCRRPHYQGGCLFGLYRLLNFLCPSISLDATTPQRPPLTFLRLTALCEFRCGYDWRQILCRSESDDVLQSSCCSPFHVEDTR